mgnify:CR=1 FL=1
MPSVRISVPRETAERETRVAAIPETVAKLRAIGHTVLVESGAGAGASHSDDAYREAGATIAPDYASCVREAEAVLRVREPSEAEIAAALEHAALAPLLPSLAYLTGDLGLLKPHLRPDALLLNQPFNGFTDAQQAEIAANRDRAWEQIKEAADAVAGLFEAIPKSGSARARHGSCRGVPRRPILSLLLSDHAHAKQQRRTGGRCF